MRYDKSIVYETPIENVEIPRFRIEQAFQRIQ